MRARAHFRVDPGGAILAIGPVSAPQSQAQTFLTGYVGNFVKVNVTLGENGTGT